MNQAKPKAKVPIRITCDVDCDGDDDSFYFHLDVSEIEGHDQGQEWDNSMSIEFIDYESFKNVCEQLKKITIQTTSEEYENECGEELDGTTAIEAWDSLILETREALQKVGVGT